MVSQNVETKNKYVDEEGLIELLCLIKDHYLTKRQYNDSIDVVQNAATGRCTLVINKVETKIG